MSRRAGAVLVLAAALALALAGCATAPPATPSAPPPVVPPVVPPAPVAVTPAPVAAKPDTVPSAEALAVLAEIPEPLRPGERAAGPAADAGTRGADAPATTGAAGPAPEDSGGGQADVPVPVPMPVLGERPLPEVVAPADTAARPALVPGAPAPAPPAAAADTCWRVQFAAWADRAKAGRYLAAARSQLGVPLTIEKEGGLFKVRTSGCVDGAAADALRRRAREAGFEGAFRFRGGKP